MLAYALKCWLNLLKSVGRGSVCYRETEREREIEEKDNLKFFNEFKFLFSCSSECVPHARPVVNVINIRETIFRKKHHIL